MPPLSPARLRYGSAAISAALLAAAHPPLAWRPLAFVALVPWFVVLLRDRGRGHGRPAYVFGLVHFVLGLSWLFPLHPAFPPALSSILALYPVLFATVVRVAARAGPGVAAWSVPLAWVAVDFLRERALSGFGYLFPGLAMAGVPGLRLAAAVGGVPLLTFVVVGANAALAAWWGWQRAQWDGRLRDRTPFPRAAAVLGVAVLLLAIGGGAWGAATQVRLKGPPPGLRVLLLQPAIPLSLKAEAAQGGKSQSQRMLDDGVACTAEGLRGHRETDLVIWAETMIPSILERPRSRQGAFDDQSAQLLRWVAGSPGTPGVRVAGGALVRDPDGHMRNVFLLLRPDGTVEARADKVHLTPFGEYLPLVGWLPEGMRDAVLRGVESISPFVPDLRPGPSPVLALPVRSGEGIVRIQPDPVRAGVLVCYEITFPAEARARVLDGAEVLLAPANYGWYGSWMHGQNLDILRTRAVETRRPIISATNDGPTVVVDERGVVTASLEPRTRGALAAEVPRGSGTTPCVAAGDLLPWLSVAGALALALTGALRRQGNLLTPPEGHP